MEEEEKEEKEEKEDEEEEVIYKAVCRRVVDTFGLLNIIYIVFCCRLWWI